MIDKSTLLFNGIVISLLTALTVFLDNPTLCIITSILGAGYGGQIVVFFTQQKNSDHD